MFFMLYTVGRHNCFSFYLIAAMIIVSDDKRVTQNAMETNSDYFWPYATVIYDFSSCKSVLTYILAYSNTSNFLSCIYILENKVSHCLLKINERD